MTTWWSRRDACERPHRGKLALNFATDGLLGSDNQLVASYLERKTKDARASIEAYLAGTPQSQRALKFFDWVVGWAESKDFRGCPLQHTVSELTDAAHPARAIVRSASVVRGAPPGVDDGGRS